MWNDFEESLPNPFFVPVNEFDPIDIDVNDVNPSIENIANGSKQLFPIFNDWNEFKFDNWNVVEFPNDPFPIDNVDNFGKSIMLSKYNISIQYLESQMVPNRNCTMLHSYYR